MTKLEKCQSKFLNMEENEKFFDLTIFNIKIWPYVKYAVYKHIANTYLNIKVTKFGYGDNRPLLKEYKYRYNINKLIKNQDILVLNEPRRTNLDGIFVNTNSDIVCEELSKKYKTLIIEDPFSIYNKEVYPLHLNPVRYQNIAYTDSIENRVAKKMNKYKHKKEFNILANFVNSLCKTIIKYFNKLNLSFLFEVVCDRILYVKFALPIFYKLIKSSKAKAVLLFYAPAQTKLVFCDVCKQLKIPTIELEHGIQTDQDPFFYQIKDKSKKISTYPDYIFSFGERTVSTKLYPYNLAKNVIPIGHPYLDFRFGQIIKTKKQKQKQKIILFLSQKSIGTEVSMFAKNLAQLLKEKQEFKIIYRLHPFESPNMYPYLNNLPNLEVVSSTITDVYNHHNIAYCQVGSYSTSLYEGLKFKLPTIILDYTFGSNITTRLLNGIKGIYHISSAKELYNLLTKNKLTRPPGQEVNKIWKNNALQNLTKNLEKIINEK